MPAAVSAALGIPAGQFWVRSAKMLGTSSLASMGMDCDRLHLTSQPQQEYINPMKNFKAPGQRYGRLVIIERIHRPTKMCYWRCQCDCGGETIASTANLHTGNTKSCG